MRRYSIVCGLVLVLLLAFVALKAHAAPASADFLRYDNDFDVASDGSYVQTFHAELRFASNAAARAAAQQVVSFSPKIEVVEVLDAATRKADGRALPVADDAIHELLPPGSPDHALIADRRQKIIVFPSVDAGDTLSYTVRRTVRRPVFPGQFTASVYLPRGSGARDVVLTVRAPRSYGMQTEAHGFAETLTSDGDRVVRSWRASAPVPANSDGAPGAYDRLPRVFVSSFQDWGEFARAYGALAGPKMAVTPAIKTLADRIADGADSRRDQARLLYDWVSTQIRYVAVYIGYGGLEPHDADAVLAHGYGDCKDHAVLFDALLAARDIGSELVLVNLTDQYSLSGPPGFAQLNHAISYLPEFDLYADTTAGTAAFGTLPFGLYGKPAVHAVDGGRVLRTIPTLPPEAAVLELHSLARLEPDGRITGTSVTTATGPFASELRHSAQWIETAGQAYAAATQLKASGGEGVGSFDFQAPEALASSYAVSGSFTLDPRPESLAGDSFAMPAGLRLGVQPGDTLLGPLAIGRRAEDEDTPCHSGRQVEELSLQLPAGRRLVRLPEGTRIDSAAVAYRSAWSVQGGMLTWRRELTSKVTAPLCTGETRRLAAAALAAIHADARTRVALADE